MTVSREGSERLFSWRARLKSVADVARGSGALQT